MSRYGIVLSSFLVAFGLGQRPDAAAHDHSWNPFQARRALALAQLRETSQPAPLGDASATSCRLELTLVEEAEEKSVPGLVRVTNLENGKTLTFPGEIQRDANWHALDRGPNTLLVPRGRLRVEACRGLDSYGYAQEFDLREKEEFALRIPIVSFYDTAALGWRAGNTHLHLMRLTRDEADRYLRVVPQADKLDLVYLSYLRRVPDERVYISNEFTEGDLRRLSLSGTLFGNGQEHRHNFGPGGEGFGHVLFLEIPHLIQPVSIGPGIMKEGTDGRPLQQGIRAAREDGASIVWCHNTFGLEDLPNWVAGLIDAQNIFDGGNQGSYEDTFYRYLNLGLRVPFSTGTDWFIYDFSRVYVPVSGAITSSSWRRALSEGRSYITNGPFLEFSVHGRPIGETLAVQPGDRLQVRGRGVGRADFGGLELVLNGKVSASSRSKVRSGAHGRRYFECQLESTLQVLEPGWVALRIAPQGATNEFGHPLFGHTSPIYLEIAGRRPFQRSLAEAMRGELQLSIDTIRDKGRFADDAEREQVLDVYRQAIRTLDDQIAREPGLLRPSGNQ